MGLDLSGIDAELDALGEVPRDLDAWISAQASELRSLSEVDGALSKLAEGVAEPRHVPNAAPRPVQARPLPAPIAAPSAQARPLPAPTVQAPSAQARPLPAPAVQTPSAQARPAQAPAIQTPSLSQLDDLRPESGEIDLGEPVQRRDDLASKELTLFDSDRPRSGSFELPEQDLRTERNEVDVFASPKRPKPREAMPISLQTERASAPIELTPLAVDFQDDDDEEQKLFASFTDQAEPDTIVSFEERDPDAEFDALFDEATHPSGIPLRNLEADDDAISADDLLSGLTAPPARESDALTSALFADLELGDATQLTDADTVAAHLDPFPSEEELGSSEFEIVLDADGEAKDLVPSHPPDAGPPSADKRPSFLGRLFGRKDEK